jgi:hypothetical protein
VTYGTENCRLLVQNLFLRNKVLNDERMAVLQYTDSYGYFAREILSTQRLVDSWVT